MQCCRLTPAFSFTGREVPALTSGASVVMGLPDTRHYFAALWLIGNTGTSQVKPWETYYQSQCKKEKEQERAHFGAILHMEMAPGLPQ